MWIVHVIIVKIVTFHHLMERRSSQQGGIVKYTCARALIFAVILLLGTNLNLIAQQTNTLQVDSVTGNPDAVASCSGMRFDFVYATIADAVQCALAGDTITLGADVYQENLIVDKSMMIIGAGAGQSVLDGFASNASTIIVEPDVALVLEGVTVTGGSAAQGGGIYTLSGQVTINNSIITANTASDAGSGIFTYAGTIEINNSTIGPNAQTQNGGGLATVAGTIIVNNSTITENSVSVNGGGLLNEAAKVALTNSTVSGNQALESGGGLATLSGAIVLNNVTVVQNVASVDGAGFNNVEGFVEASNSLLAGNIGADCGGMLNSAGHNLIQDANCSIEGDATGNLIGVDPLLGDFDDYNSIRESEPQLYELLTNSPAINAGNAMTCALTDQRGASREVDRCDIGAYEGLRGDCNSDLRSDAGDIAALALEVNGSASFEPNSVGCDADADLDVDVDDIACTQIIIFAQVATCTAP